jgi:hypothetical protein
LLKYKTALKKAEKGDEEPRARRNSFKFEDFYLEKEEIYFTRCVLKCPPENKNGYATAQSV